MHVVWFKRDLRIHDHRPLLEAAARGDVLCLYVYEPELLASPELGALRRKKRKVRAQVLDALERMVKEAGSLLMLNVVRGNGSLFILVQ